MKKLISLIMIFTLLAINVIAVEYNVVKSKKNLVKFISKTTLDEFEGVTSKIDGYLVADGIDKLEGAEFYFEVDMKSVDTGIGLRNRDMREKYMHTDKYPRTSFKGKIIKSTKEGNKAKVTAEGDMFIHGVTKKIKVDGTVASNDNGIRIQSKFNIKLADYNIERPSFILLRLSEVVNLVMDFQVSERK